MGRRLYRVSLFFRRGLKMLSRICIISCIVLHRRSLLGIGLGRFRRRLLGRVMENVGNADGFGNVSGRGVDGSGYGYGSSG